MEDLNLRKHVAIDEYPATWQRIIGEWLEENQRDAFWLTYSANYIFSTAGFHWAIDPYSLLSRFDGGKKQDYLKDIAGIKLIILTHAHSDHLDLNLINALKNESITWVIPEFMFEKVVNRIPLDKDRIIVPEPGIPLCIDHLSLLPFEGLHFYGEQGVHSMGYLIEFNQKRWLFPGDIRTYDFSRLPEFGDLDGVVAHLWLGKGQAQESKPSKLGEFCEFFSNFHTKFLVITHLMEYGRELSDLWDLHHFQMVKNQLQLSSPGLKICAGLMGECIEM